MMPLQPWSVPDKNPEWPLVEYKNTPSPRDKWGILWQHDGLDRSGKPEFGQVNTGRQVSCMLNRRCQVCGYKIEGDETPFMVGNIENKTLIHMEFRTTTPPVCLDCAQIATGLCPDLKKGHGLLMAKSYEPVGVFGQVYMYNTENQQMYDHGMTDMPLGHPGLRSTIGKQLIVQLKV